MSRPPIEERRPAENAPAAIDVTWIGHATVDLSVGGIRFLTDPVLVTRFAHLRRRCPLPQLHEGPLDAVLVSHLHHDHLHLESLRRLPRGLLVVPRGAARLLGRIQRSDALEVVPGDVVEVGGATVRVVHADHDGGRPPSRHRGPALGFLIEAAGRRIYFPGDTDLFDGMGGFAPVDLALLPIWGWGPRLGTGHLTPGRAATAAALVQAASVVPVHWGTYSPVRLGRGRPAWIDRPAVEFAAALPVAAPASRLVMLLPGEHARIDPTA